MKAAELPTATPSIPTIYSRKRPAAQRHGVNDRPGQRDEFRAAFWRLSVAGTIVPCGRRGAGSKAARVRSPVVGTYSMRQAAICGGCLLVWLLAAAAHCASEEWPQWRGPTRNGQSNGVKPPSAWPKELDIRWQVEVGLGHSSPIVSDRQGLCLRPPRR